MKIKMLAGDLQKNLPFIHHAISSRNQLPVLSNFLLETEENTIKISATDLEIGIQLIIPATVEETGGITIPAKIFSELIASLPQEEIILQTKGELLEVISKKTKSTFQTIAKEEFPALYKEKGERIVVFKKGALEDEFVKVAFAASLDSGRPALSAVLIKKDAEIENALFFVATDGYRLSLKRHAFDIKKKDTWEKPLLIPARVIREVILAKQTEGGEGEIELFVSGGNNQVLFSWKDALLVGRLIEGEFPNYEKIIPTDVATTVSFDKDELQKAVKTCSIFARETANIVRFSVKKNAIVVSANTPSVGENTVEVEAKVDGEENEIAFNARYLLELFSHIDKDDMTFEMTGPLNPGVFKIKDDDSFLHLIMPIRVQG